jgi:hypothetical protein
MTRAISVRARSAEKCSSRMFCCSLVSSPSACAIAGSISSRTLSAASSSPISVRRSSPGECSSGMSGTGAKGPVGIELCHASPGVQPGFLHSIFSERAIAHEHAGRVPGSRAIGFDELLGRLLIALLNASHEVAFHPGAPLRLGIGSGSSQKTSLRKAPAMVSPMESSYPPIPHQRMDLPLPGAFTAAPKGFVKIPASDLDSGTFGRV